MTFGASPYGYVPFGAPVALTSAYVPPLPVLAARYNPETREYDFDGDGNVQTIHPVDQEVAHRLTVNVGSISSAPTMGIDLARLRIATDEQADSIFADMVATALAPLVQAGDVTIIGTPRASTVRGRLIYFVDYTNNRDTSNTERRRLSVNGS